MKHNSYFEGKVQSLGINGPKGYATVGVIEPGQYSFSTAQEEQMTVIAGVLRAKLPGKDWADFGEGRFFIVPPKATFEVEAKSDVAYICYYR